MTNAIELFEKHEGKWRPLSLASCTGAAIRKEVWASMEGKEITGKLTRNQQVIGYVAGTEELRSYYGSKTGVKTWSWAEAAEAMEKKESPLLDDDHGILSGVLSVFGEGCKVVRVEYDHI